MINQIKEILHKRKGEEILLICDEGRNVIRKEVAVIKEVYKSLFILEVKKSNQTTQIESFSYADLLTEVIKLVDDEGQPIYMQ